LDCCFSAQETKAKHVEEALEDMPAADEEDIEALTQAISLSLEKPPSNSANSAFLRTLLEAKGVPLPSRDSSTSS
jgi:hypothetical protein